MLTNNLAGALMRYLFFLILLLTASLLTALQVPYSETPIQTDENMLSGLQRVNPEDYIYEPNPTKAWLWQDEKNLCFIIESHVDSSFVAGPISTRDTSNKADYLRIQLITLPDAYFSYLFNFYSTGNLYDAVRESNRADFNFNTNYQYESTINGSLWQIRGKIPLGELRFSHKPPYNWKIILTRHHDKTSEDYNLPPLKPALKNDYFTKAYDIRLEHQIKRELNLKFKPYLVRSFDLQEKTSSFDPDNLGLDVIFNPAQRTRIKLSLNPDFSDVPPDEAADIYNSKYPRFYIENRFFFTEDLDAFGTTSDMFYSRKIIQPTVAFKATGHEKSLNWGFLAAKDKEIMEPGYPPNYDDYYQVVSLMPKTSKLTFANTLITRMNKDYYNHVYSGNWTWNPNSDFRISSLNGFSIREDDRSSDQAPTTGSINNLTLAYTPKEWNFDLYGSYVSRNMNADAGYFNNRFFHKFGADLAWESEESLDFLSYQGFSAYWEYWKRYAEHNTEDVVSASYYINFRPKFGFTTNLSTGRELDLLNNDHEVYSAQIVGTIFRWQPFNVQFGYEYSDQLVYSLLKTYDADYFYANVWGSISKVFGYDLSCSLKDYSYPKGILADYGGLLPYTIPLDDCYVIFNGEISYTPHQRLRLACGSGLSTYEDEGLYSDLSLYGNLRYEFKPNCFVYCGFNTNQLQDEKNTYDDLLGHFVVYTSTAYAKVSLEL
jgi:hypothetical protein